MSIKFYGPLFNGRDTASKSVRVAADVAARTGLFVLRANSPVDTGLLQSSWQIRPAGRGVQIFNPTPYAIYQEAGTRFMEGRHMIGRSLPSIEAAFVNELAAQVGRNLSASIIGKVQASPVSTWNYSPKNKTVYGKLTKGDRNIPNKGGIRPKKFYGSY